VGIFVGCNEGVLLGCWVGVRVGEKVGVDVGRSDPPPQTSHVMAQSKCI